MTGRDVAGMIGPAPGSFRPGVVDVRLVGTPDVIDAAVAQLVLLHGDAWQPGIRQKSRHDGGQVLQRGTLIVPVPR